MNRPNQIYPNLGGYQNDSQQQQQHINQQSQQQTPVQNINYQQSQQDNYGYQQQIPSSSSSSLPQFQSIYRQQTPQQTQQQQPLQQQSPQQSLQQQQSNSFLTSQFVSPGLSNSLYRDNQTPFNQNINSPTVLQNSQLNNIINNNPTSPSTISTPSTINSPLENNKTESLLNITTFDKDEDLKKIFTNSIESLDGNIEKVATIPDPTLKVLFKRDPGFNYFESNSYFWSTLVIEKHIELPKEITDALLTTSTKSSYGLFPEINRAWISIDQTLFLWDYKNNETVSHNLSQVIINCSLVTPKKNTFKDNVKKVMVVCTHVEIFLFALCYSSDDNKFELLSGLSIPTDNTYITDIVGTKEGRIFLSGQDGHIYEIEYSKDSLYWFSNERIKKVKLTQGFVENFINFQKKSQIIQLMYDEERHLIYSLTRESIITVYSLGVNADKFEHHRTIKPIQDYEQQIYSNNINGMGGVRQKQFVMSIHSSSKETQFNFIAILSGGQRLYYTIEKLAYIRSPPNIIESYNSHPQATGNIHYTYYNNGVFFTATSVNDKEDRLIGTTLFGNDIIKQHFEVIKTNYSNQISQDTLSEKANLFSIRGRVSVIKEDITNIGSQTVYFKELANEHMTIQRRFLCLNSLGLHFITKLKYVDILQNILSTNNLNDIDNFFEAFGKIITSSLCIGLYCLSPHSSIILQNQIYSSTNIPKTTSTRISDLAMTYFRRNSGKPSIQQQQSLPLQTFSDMGSAVNRNEMLYSNAYNGLLSYLSRLLYPLWDQPIILPSGQCNWSIVQIQLYQSHFSNLLSFLEISQLIPKSSEIPIIKLNKQQQQQQNNQLEEIALRNEKRSLIGLKNIIVKTIEVLSLLLILSQFNFKQLFDSSNIPDEVKRKINLIKFRDVLNNDILGKPSQPLSINSPSLNNTLTTGSPSPSSPSTSTNENLTSNLTNIINQLIDSLMRSLNNHNINIDQISNQLETECPIFFRRDKRELYKVKEKLNMVLRDGSIYLTETLIRDSIVILESISPNFEINEIVDLLIQCKAFQYISPLCLKYAQDLDPRSITLNPTSNPSDEILEKLKQKKNCFKQIILLLNLINGDGDSDSNSNSYSTDDYSSGEMIQKKNEIINIIINQSLVSNDRLVHELVYSWLLRNGYTERVYDINTPFITDYLFANEIDLCWKVLAKHQDYIKAAQVLFEIADRSTNLEDKITAYTNCTMILSERKDEDYYIHAKNQITAANIQKQIIIQLEDILNGRTSNNNSDNNNNNNKVEIRQAISNLNQKIFDYTELFTEYARKYFLYEQMLYICHIGNHNDQAFIQLLWKIIIDQVVPSKNNNGDNRSVTSIMESLASKISNIGYDFYPNEITFPVSYIINIAEKSIFDYTSNKPESELSQISPNWLTSSLHDHVKIDYWILVDSYNTIIEKENWKDDKSMLYIIRSYFYLVESLINTIQTSTERRLFTSKQILQSLELREKTFKSILEKNNQLNNNDNIKLQLNKFQKIISISRSFKDFRY